MNVASQFPLHFCFFSPSTLEGLKIGVERTLDLCPHGYVSGSVRALILNCRAGSINLLIKDFENAACSKVVNLVVFVF
jgi:hypothetical protein